jgi:hypothetical protein
MFSLSTFCLLYFSNGGTETDTFSSLSMGLIGSFLKAAMKHEGLGAREIGEVSCMDLTPGVKQPKEEGYNLFKTSPCLSSEF